MLLLLSSLNAAPKKIHLIWLHDPNHFWEKDWLPEILSEVHCEIDELADTNCEQFLDNSIFIIPDIPSNKCKQHFSRCRAMGLKFGIIHLSDEFYAGSDDFYKHAVFVLRNYWHKKYLNMDNVSFFPLGYTYKFWNNFTGQITDSSHRKYTWSFPGHANKSTRLHMLANMILVPNYFVHDTSVARALASEQYRDLLLDSIFVPCPKGNWNIDSFRVTESLECGCIPIVETHPFDYYAKLLGSHPFPSVYTWDEAPALIAQLLANPEKLEKLRIDCYEWWQNYKKDLKARLALLIETSFASDQFLQ